jgi:alkyldihydroxyacetonephosphate synthase
MRDRSFWAWGYEDRFPDTAARAALGEQVGALLGVGPLVPADPPTLESISMPEAKLAVPAALAPIASTDRRERALHSHGRAYRDLVRGFRGDFSAAPDVVVFPRDEAEVAACLAWATSERVVIVPFGGGTSVVGGVEAERRAGDAGIVSLDLRAMDRVREVEPLSRTARIEAGVLGPSMEAQLGERGFTLRHFPQSFEHSTLGGWIATRAGGHFATLATHIDDLVAGVRMVTPTGVLVTPRLPASGAGPSADRLVLGSEGILGVITEAWVRVRPRPRFRASATVLFGDLMAAAEAVRAIVQAGLFPSNCRVLDPHEAKLAFVPADGGAALLLAFESEDHPLGPWMERGVALAAAHGGRLPRPPRHREEGERGGDAAAEAWRKAFFEGPYLQSSLVTLGVVADTFETACPWDRFPALHEAVTRAVHDAIARVSGAPGLVSCRFTHAYLDGVAPYYTFVAPPPKVDVLEAWQVIKNAASDALHANGGTITHHHAVGRTHRPWYDRERSAPFAEALRAAKKALDPAGVLNPGVLIDPLGPAPRNQLTARCGPLLPVRGTGPSCWCRRACRRPCSTRSRRYTCRPSTPSTSRCRHRHRPRPPTTSRRCCSTRRRRTGLRPRRCRRRRRETLRCRCPTRPLRFPRRPTPACRASPTRAAT